MSTDRSSEYGTVGPYQSHGGMNTRDMRMQIGGQTVILTPEDLQLMRQCGRECFATRIMPLTVASCGGVYFLAKSGYIRSSFFKYAGAFAASFFFGKLSYIGRCKELIANSNLNTPFVEAVRRKRNADSATSFGGKGSTDSWKRNDDRGAERWKSSSVGFDGGSTTDSWTRNDDTRASRWKSSGVGFNEGSTTDSWTSNDDTRADRWISSGVGFSGDKSTNSKWGGFAKDEIGYTKEEAPFDNSPTVNDPFNDKDLSAGETMSANQPKYASYDELRQRNRSSFKY